jgi:hypothetical protein
MDTTKKTKSVFTPKYEVTSVDSFATIYPQDIDSAKILAEMLYEGGMETPQILKQRVNGNPAKNDLGNHQDARRNRIRSHALFLKKHKVHIGPETETKWAYFLGKPLTRTGRYQHVETLVEDDHSLSLS